jgi:hypothetical protein
VVALSQTSVSTNMVSTLSTNVFTADQHIAALEQEIFNLRNARRTFDGVEILKPPQISSHRAAQSTRVNEKIYTTPEPTSSGRRTSSYDSTTSPPFHQHQGDILPATPQAQLCRRRRQTKR